MTTKPGSATERLRVRREEHPVDPHLFVVFGGTGDLMRRKLLPALHALATEGFLHDKCMVLGVSRSRDLDADGYRKMAREALSSSGFAADDLARWCDTRLMYLGMGEETPDDFRALGARIEAIERKVGIPGNRTLYLAIPPAGFPGVIRGLGGAGLHRSRGWTRLVIEKPFGRDLESARELNAIVHGYFGEEQVYRIDHYLGKETVQNLLAFRFGNAIFESIWNRDRIAGVCITVAEDLGIGRRAAYYEQAGVVRDMIQNHLTQLLALTAMEVPSSFTADAIRYEKVKTLRSISPLKPGDAVFGQYAGGKIDGRSVPGYRDEAGVAAQSNRETFVALRLEIDNWRWQGVPFVLRTGKRLERRMSQIEVTFRRPPVSIFRPGAGGGIEPNVLTIALQPDEGFDLSFEVKAPGQGVTLKTERMHFRYAEAFGPLADAYRTLLLDVMLGDQTLFVHADEVEASWRLYDPLLEAKHPVHPYAAGTWGPAEAERIVNGGAG